MKKQILSIAILAILPLTAMADPVVSVGPAAVPSNGTAVIATANPPYQTSTVVDPDDKQHIASTAYVKGAYNDAIAAVNKVADDVSELTYFVNNDLQYAIVTSDNNNVVSDLALSAGDLGNFGTEVLYHTNDVSWYNNELTRVGIKVGASAAESLMTTEAVLQLARDLAKHINIKLDNKRVEIYTTWDNDNATRQVAFVTASE